VIASPVTADRRADRVSGCGAGCARSAFGQRSRELGSSRHNGCCVGRSQAPVAVELPHRACPAAYPPGGETPSVAVWWTGVRGCIPRSGEVRLAGLDGNRTRSCPHVSKHIHPQGATAGQPRERAGVEEPRSFASIRISAWLDTSAARAAPGSARYTSAIHDPPIRAWASGRCRLVRTRCRSQDPMRAQRERSRQRDP
jgi:hypothetical protein